MIKQYLARLIQRVFDLASGGSLAETEAARRAEARALFSLASIAPVGYVPWPQPSLSPVTLATILNDIVLNTRHTVVELGAGISTIYLARVLQDCGGKLWSVDQDRDWCRTVRELAERESVDSCLEIVAAPLATHSSRGYEGPWYDETVLSQCCPCDDIDLLIVDGPGSDFGAPLIRYPAAAFFEPRLSQTCLVVLDDSNRDGEQAVIEAWNSELGFSFRNSGNAAYFSRGPHYLPWL